MEQETYLAHHGVLGMKWGIRNAETLARYSRGKSHSKPSKYSAKKNRYERTYAKAKSSKYSKSREKREASLKAQGYGDKQATVVAYNEDRAKKIVAVAAGVAVAAIVGYAGYKYVDAHRDKLLKRSTPLYRVSGSTDIHTDKFYAAYKKGDVQMYNALMGGIQASKGHSYSHEIDFGKDVKVMSEAKARETVSKLLSDKDSNFYKEVSVLLDRRNAYYDPHNRYGRLYKRADKDLKAGKTNTKAIYDSINIALVGPSDPKDLKGGRTWTTGTLASTIGKAVKQAGYDAIEDVNDKKYSGFNAKTPLIMFGDSSVTSKVREISVKEIGIDALKVGAKGSLKVYALPLAAMVGLNVYASTEDRIVKAYKKDHPNTSLSDDDILKNYYA